MDSVCNNAASLCCFKIVEIEEMAFIWWNFSDKRPRLGLTLIKREPRPLIAARKNNSGRVIDTHKQYTINYYTSIHFLFYLRTRPAYTLNRKFNFCCCNYFNYYFFFTFYDVNKSTVTQHFFAILPLMDAMCGTKMMMMLLMLMVVNFSESVGCALLW